MASQISKENIKVNDVGCRGERREPHLKYFWTMRHRMSAENRSETETHLDLSGRLS